MELRTKFQDEDFELGEVADVAMATNPDGRITLRAKANKGGEITVYYKSLKDLTDDWEDYGGEE